MSISHTPPPGSSFELEMGHLNEMHLERSEAYSPSRLMHVKPNVPGYKKIDMVDKLLITGIFATLPFSIQQEMSYASCKGLEKCTHTVNASMSLYLILCTKKIIQLAVSKCIIPACSCMRISISNFVSRVF